MSRMAYVTTALCLTVMLFRFGESGNAPAPADHSSQKSCKMYRATDKTASSGEYEFTTKSGLTLKKVYCEMGLNDGGYMFIHPSDLPRLTQDDLNAIITDTASLLLRVRLTNGIQKYGVLKQLTQYSTVPLSLQVHSNGGYNTPVNANNLGCYYMYAGFLPISHASGRSTQGLQVNGNEITFFNCDGSPNSQLTLFPNFNETAVSGYAYGTSFPMYNSFLSSLRDNPSRRVIPDDFFTFFEMHHGGCGMYTQSDSRQDVVSAAIGFR